MPRRWGRSEDTGAKATTVECNAHGYPDEKVSDHSDKIVVVKKVHADKKSSSDKKDIAAKYNEVTKLTYYERGQYYDVCVSLRDPLPRPAIPGVVSAYRLKLRAVWLRKQGVDQAEAAKRLGCPAGSLNSVWHSPINEIPRAPKEVSKYIARYESRMLDLGVEPFREPILRRGYATHLTDAYAECAAALPWEQAVLRKRNHETGEVAITNIASSRQDCSFGSLETGLPHIDEVLQKLKDDLDIKDPGAYLMCNWYLDGNTNIASHQHDFWSAIISFGAPRIFLLDGQPMLLGHGDLLVFGTQRHCVPKMPSSVQEGRISIAIFWYPERTKADATFNITLDPSMINAALSSNVIAQAIAESAAADISKIKLDTNGRGVGKRVDENVVDISDSEEDGLLSEERLMQIALQVSLMEQ